MPRSVDARGRVGVVNGALVAQHARVAHSVRSRGGVAL